MSRRDGGWRELEKRETRSTGFETKNARQMDEGANDGGGGGQRGERVREERRGRAEPGSRKDYLKVEKGDTAVIECIRPAGQQRTHRVCVWD